MSCKPRRMLLDEEDWLTDEVVYLIRDSGMTALPRKVSSCCCRLYAPLKDADNAKFNTRLSVSQLNVHRNTLLL